jgi:hypothetical protein
MKLEEAVTYFGSPINLCTALGLKKQNYTRWRKAGCIPYVTQMRLQELTNGYLKADPWRVKK